MHINHKSAAALLVGATILLPVLASALSSDVAVSVTASGTLDQEEDLSLDQDSLGSITDLTPIGAAQVESSAEARAFEATLLRADKNLRSIDLSGDKVVVSYNERGYFLGIMPVIMPVTVTVEANGKISLEYPWYYFLIREDKERLESALTSTTTARSLGARAMIAANIVQTLIATNP
ncbi:hypothetical protein KW785_01625 [Candidatus Parcubacteria bacterium]|nr:hypothetical protein [Candidatus Parcubacteria bacterium]